MPSCSQCSQEKSRDAFTKAQLRKGNTTRRCKQCIDGEFCHGASITSARRAMALRKHSATILRGERVASGGGRQEGVLSLLWKLWYWLITSIQRMILGHQPPRQLPLSGTYATEIRKLVSTAAQEILKRGIPSDVGLDGLNAEELEARLWEVSNNEKLIWLTVPLLVGLVSGRPDIDEKIHFMEGQEPIPIIMWLCQYKYLKAQFNYHGGDDMVALALAAGADISVTVSNGCNALFFAVKYSSVRTVELLLDAEIKFDKRDCYGQTVWKNAVERPDLNIIKVLLERCNSVIPVAEVKFKGGDPRGGPIPIWTLPEMMIDTYAGILSVNTQSDTVPISWRLLGAPKVDDLATALVRVLHAGARFSPRTLKDVEGRLDSLAFATHVDSPGLHYQRHSETQLNIVRKLRDVVYGRWLPEAILNEVKNVHQKCSPDNTCPICLDEMDPSSTPITLYCGHKFCLDCIKEFGKSCNLVDDQRWTDKRCPICRRLLCGDLLSQDNLRLRRLKAGMRLGIDRHETDDDIQSGRTWRGPHLLTDEQLRFECKYVSGKTGGTRDSLLNKLSQSTSRSPRSGEFIVNNRHIPIHQENMKVELSASATMVLGTNATLLCAPKWGPVVVPIVVKNVPILASLSQNSTFTVLPKAVVRSFGLKTKPIASSEFIDLSGKHVGVSEVVDEFIFFLKDVEICLNNAIVLSEEPLCLRGVQLGLDFFETALWTRCSVRLEGNMNIVSDGGYNMNTFSKNQPSELRYYSRDGKICQVPFIHVSDYGRTKSLPPIVGLPADVSTQCAECRWCCRYFPCDGLLKHSSDIYYCDEDCKAKGLVIRTS